MARRPDSLNATKFNELYPIGSAFRYYSIAGSKDYIETETRSECWELGDGHPVVLIKGRAGGVSIHHLVKA